MAVNRGFRLVEWSIVILFFVPIAVQYVPYAVNSQTKGFSFFIHLFGLDNGGLSSICLALYLVLSVDKDAGDGGRGVIAFSGVLLQSKCREGWSCVMAGVRSQYVEYI